MSLTWGFQEAPKQEKPSNPEAFTAKTRCFLKESDLSGHESVVNRIMRSHFPRESVRKAWEASFSRVSISATKFHRQPKLARSRRYSRDVTRARTFNTHVFITSLLLLLLVFMASWPLSIIKDDYIYSLP